MKRKGKNVWRPVAAGFGVMYLVTMGLATCQVKGRFVQEYEQRLKESAAYILKRVTEKEFSMEGDGWESRQTRIDFYQAEANGHFWRVEDTGLQISLGFYDEEKRLLAQSRNTIGGGSVWLDGIPVRTNLSYGLDEILSQEEKEQLAAYQWKNIQARDPDKPDLYQISVCTSQDKETLFGIYVQRLTWTREEEWDGTSYKDPLCGNVQTMEIVSIDYETGEEINKGCFHETDSEIVWQWTDQGADLADQKDKRTFRTALGLPYLTSYESWRGYEDWKRWDRSQYLRSFPQEGIFTWERGIEEPSVVIESDGFYYRGKYQLKAGMTEDPSYYMEIRMEGRPWLAAMDYMKYSYGAGLVLTIGCMVMILGAFNRTYNAQEALEQTRRDFINGIAHELKTPLGVIRNFAENLAEHNMEEKRDYYLTQIIGQTEEMDQLIVKMIQLSRLDSEKLVLKKEPVSLAEVIDLQLGRLEPMIKEKQIQVHRQRQEDFVINGDEEYLAQALWNLLSNAVDYNMEKGNIAIVIQNHSCIIENTTDKAGTKKDGHMGMGLLLAEKIMKLHGLKLTLEYTEDGARAVVKNAEIPYLVK